MGLSRDTADLWENLDKHLLEEGLDNTGREEIPHLQVEGQDAQVAQVEQWYDNSVYVSNEPTTFHEA